MTKLAEDGGELDLRASSDDGLVGQMHDDLYDGYKGESVEGVNILLGRGWPPYDVLTKAPVEGMRIVGIDFHISGFFLMSNRGHGRHAKPDRHPGDAGTTRQRQCLMCRLRFFSAWSGERICPSCKRRSLWSSGIRLPSSSRPA